MKETSLKTDTLVMVLVIPLAFFVTKGLYSDSGNLSFNYFLTCFVSVTLGLLLGAAFFRYFLIRIRKIKLFPFIAWLIILGVGLLLGLFTVEFIEDNLSIINSIEFMMGFFLAAWTLSLKSPGNINGKSS
ncbi:MAG TPA: hypothetical protein VKY35_09175 [Aliidiomarina sp.]|nr:hypothetical protein [Aliidiomarina sp.]